jgi:carboxypeptidase Taq
MINDDLKRLKEIDKEISLITSAANLLWWDRASLMPKKAAEERSEQISYLAVLTHEKATSKELNDIIKRLTDNLSKIDSTDKAIVKNYSWRLSRINKLPKEHVAEMFKVTGMAQHYWEIAKKNNDFKLFEPYLEKIVELKKKEAKYIDPNTHPYEVLLQDYERGMTLQVLDQTFNKLKPELQSLIQRVKKSSKYGKEFNVKNRGFPVETQKIICQDISTMILEDNERFLIAGSVHPFMIKVSSNDLRITTAFREDPFFSFFSTAHESGHALYESEFDEKLRYTILHDAPSLGIHESQSRIWENQICRSKNFWRYYYPKYQEAFPQLENVPLERFYDAINTVRPSFIRIESDELTYTMHIIIRYEIEKDLIEGKIKVSELPKIWNSKYEKYLGISPKTYSEGLLQDVHWSQGSIAYFPTYTLGTIYSAMMYEQMLKENPKLEQEIAKGDLKFIKKWLKEKIHIHGSSMLTPEIIRKACGKDLNSDALLKYYKNKFGEIYGA